MKRHSLTAIAAICAIGLVSTIITACNGSSAEAADSLTMAQVNSAIHAAIAPLQKQISDQADEIAALKQSEPTTAQLTALQKVSRLYLQIAAPNLRTTAMHTESYGASDAGLHPQSTAPTCTGLGTLTGHPSTSDPRTSSLLAGVSCTGYLYTINASQTGGSSHVQSLGYPDWAQPACQGTMYLEVSAISQLALNSGVVFSLPAGMISDWNDPADYVYLPPNPVAQSIVPVSTYDPARGCVSLSSPALSAYATLPNDPSVTGIPSGLIDGPVGMGTP